MAQLTKAQLTADIVNNIYTNTSKLIKGNTTRDRLVNIVESMLIKDEDADKVGGYMKIGSGGYVDISFIKSAAPTTHKFLRDDGTWSDLTADYVPLERTITINGSALDLSEDREWTIDAVPTGRTITINGTAYDLSANRSWTIDAVPTGRTITINGTAYDLSANRSWTIDAVPTVRTITINGTTYDLSANRSWTVSGGLSGSGAAGRVAVWDGASSLNGYSNLFWDSTNNRMGVGIASPSVRMHVEGATGGDCTIWLRDSTLGKLIFNASSSGSDYGIAVGTQWGVSGQTQLAYFVRATGYAGVETRAEQNNQGAYYNAVSGGVSGVLITYGPSFGGAQSSSYIMTNISGGKAWIASRGGDVWLGGTDVGSTPHAYILYSNGYFGVGVSPSAKAHFKGAVGQDPLRVDTNTVDRVLYVTSAATVNIKTTRTDYEVNFNWGNDSKIGVYYDASYNNYIQFDQSNRSIKLQSRGGDGNQKIQFFINESEAGRFDNNRKLILYQDLEVQGSTTTVKNIRQPWTDDSYSYYYFGANTYLGTRLDLSTIVGQSRNLVIESVSDSGGVSVAVGIKGSGGVLQYAYRAIEDSGKAYSIIKANNQAIANASLDNAEMSFYLNEAADAVIIKAKYAGGTVKTGVVYLT